MYYTAMENKENIEKIIVETKYYNHNQAFRFVCDETIDKLTIAYETYGTLNAKKDNAILICHALSGDAHAAFYNNESDRKPGWWDVVIGSGKAIDTDKFFVISSNVIGGCAGTTGPSSINKTTNKPYGSSFPFTTIEDMVEVEKILIDSFGIEKLFAVVGGSMGGMQTALWAKKYASMVSHVVILASALYQSAQNIALHEVGRSSINKDSHFLGGDYYESEDSPKAGLAIARMLAHISYLSNDSIREKFGRTVEIIKEYTPQAESSHYRKERFQVGNYLEYQGMKFIERFDANSYIQITRAVDHFDLGYTDNKASIFENVSTEFFVMGFSTDWLYPPYHSLEIAQACKASSCSVSFCSIESKAGHDAFLLKNAQFEDYLAKYLNASYEKIQNISDNSLNYEYRLDFDIIFNEIKPLSKVLDLGCGDGILLKRLNKEKDCTVQGVEIDEDLFAKCLENNVPVLSENIETILKDYKDNAFDYIILNFTIQLTRNTKEVMTEALRVGRHVIISYPNFGYIGMSLYQIFKGRMPISKSLPFEWHNTPNVHVLTIKDFKILCDEIGCTIEKSFYYNDVNEDKQVHFWANKLALNALSILTK